MPQAAALTTPGPPTLDHHKAKRGSTLPGDQPERIDRASPDQDSLSHPAAATQSSGLRSKPADVPQSTGQAVLEQGRAVTPAEASHFSRLRSQPEELSGSTGQAAPASTPSTAHPKQSLTQSNHLQSGPDIMQASGQAIPGTTPATTLASTATASVSMMTPPPGKLPQRPSEPSLTAEMVQRVHDALKEFRTGWLVTFDAGTDVEEFIARVTRKFDQSQHLSDMTKVMIVGSMLSSGTIGLLGHKLLDASRPEDIYYLLRQRLAPQSSKFLLRPPAQAQPSFGNVPKLGDIIDAQTLASPAAAQCTPPVPAPRKHPNSASQSQEQPSRKRSAAAVVTSSTFPHLCHCAVDCDLLSSCKHGILMPNTIRNSCACNNHSKVTSANIGASASPLLRSHVCNAM